MIKGKEIILAGGSGGLGSATARLFAAEGANLVISYKSKEQRALSLEDIASLVRCDLLNREDRQALLDRAPALYGLVVFAGDPARVSDPAELESAMQRSYESNYLGPILLARDAAQKMQTAKTSGAIVLLSTMQAVSIFPGSTAYAAQKAALIHAARILAKEYRGPGEVRVNVVCPGVNRAGMAEASIASGKYDRYIVEGTISRFGQAADVARAVRFFLEPDNYVTGQVLTVDDGLTL